MSIGIVFLTPPRPRPLAIVLGGRAIEIGRHPRATVRLAEPTVSARHVTLRRRGQAYVMTDEGSPNGTLIVTQGQEEAVVLGPDAPRVVQNHDRVHLGHALLEFRTQPPFFDDQEVELLEEKEALPEQLVRTALSDLGLTLAQEELREAVETLLNAPFELVSKSGVSGALPDEQGKAAKTTAHDVVLCDPAPLDWIIALCAVALLSGAGVALYRLIERS